MISTAVFLSELTKLLVCSLLFSREQVRIKLSAKEPQPSYSFGTFVDDVFGTKSNILFLSVPAFLYTIQNSLQYVAIGMLDAATFQVTAQLKILTTAMLSVWFLGMVLSLKKWLSLVLLMMGVALVQLPSNEEGDEGSDDITSRIGGLSALLLACILSGMAGVYFEMILKGIVAKSTVPLNNSIWLRNVQLSIFSIGFCVISGVTGLSEQDERSWSTTPFFQGINHASVIGAILLNAFGGMVVASVVKYTDNVAKGFATSIAIILSTFISPFIFPGWEWSPTSLLGSAMVISSTLLYATPDDALIPVSKLSSVL